MTETKLCADCKQAFPMNESGHLVVPFFDMHSTMCERCGTPLNIEYKEDGSIHFSCSFHHMVGSTSSRFSGHSPMYCPYCDEKRREKRRQKISIPCCICQQKKGPALNTYQGYHLWGGGTAIRPYCNNRDCEKVFLALPTSHQTFYIRQRCDLAFPRGQIIYGLDDPESHYVRYLGRTHDQKSDCRNTCTIAPLYQLSSAQKKSRTTHVLTGCMICIAKACVPP